MTNDEIAATLTRKVRELNDVLGEAQQQGLRVDVRALDTSVIGAQPRAYVVAEVFLPLGTRGS